MKLAKLETENSELSAKLAKVRITAAGDARLLEEKIKQCDQLNERCNHLIDRVIDRR